MTNKKIITKLKQTKQKIYCYVDETGQDTAGKLFLVSVIIQCLDINKVEHKLKDMEKQSGKRKRKWKTSTPKQRISYIEQIIESNLFKDSIFFAKYEDTKAYVSLTILTTANAILTKVKKEKEYKANIWVDGLRKTERRRFANGLRKLRVNTDKVRGLKDENSALIRLADAAAGFVRDSLEGNKELRKLYDRALKNKILREV